jgi:hypothetical protein
MGIELKQTPTGGLGGWDDLSGAQGAIVMSLAANVNRAPTNTVTLGTIPANAKIISIFVANPVVSNAGTTATVSVGLSGGSATYFTAAQDVKTAVGNFSQAATAGWAPSTAAQTLTVTYTETGTASSAGTQYVAVNYCVV